MNPVVIGDATLYLGNCVELMASLPENSLDSIICDPPYLINFMGRSFDSQHKSLPGANEGQKMQEWHRRWVTEAYRLLKPGGHLAAFGGDRTHHRLMSAMEDVGFELRFSLYWCYGSGFPKSLDAEKVIDKIAGRIGSSVGSIKKIIKDAHIKSGLTLAQLNNKCGFEASGYLRDSSTWANVLPSKEKWAVIRDVLELSFEIDSLFQQAEREVIGFQRRGIAVNTSFMSGGNKITAPATPEAAQWAGYGTATKPAVEICAVGRKPMIGTLAENLLTWGCGALNLDACRVGTEEITSNGEASLSLQKKSLEHGIRKYEKGLPGANIQPSTHIGRFPPHLLHDGSDLVKKCFPDTTSGKPCGVKKASNNIYGQYGVGIEITGIGDSGSASRFFPSLPYDEEDCATLFYCGKASRTDRNQGCEGMDVRTLQAYGDFAGTTDHAPKQNVSAFNNHPTTKPTPLMRWICRLLTPKGGTLLDPFMGSGSTLKAAVLEGFTCMGMEMDADYFDIACARVAHVSPEAVMVKPLPRTTTNPPAQGSLL